jgi:hypothetical protein
LRGVRVLGVLSTKRVRSPASSTVALHFEVIFIKRRRKIIIIAFTALYRQFDKIALASKRNIFAAAFFEGLPITRIDFPIEDCMNVCELFSFKKYIRALIAGFDSVMLYLGIFGVENIIFLAESFGT